MPVAQFVIQFWREQLILYNLKLILTFDLDFAMVGVHINHQRDLIGRRIALVGEGKADFLKRQKDVRLDNTITFVISLNGTSVPKVDINFSEIVVEPIWI